MPGWDQQRLDSFVSEAFHGAPLVVVSNREPYLHEYAPDGSIQVRRSVGGVSISFDSILSATQGLWVAYGGSSADRAVTNARDEVLLPPDSPRYTLKRVWMEPREREGYYNGFANQTLWPLCHVAFVKPSFRPSDWRSYVAINRRFAHATAESLRGQPGVVWLQDYHFALTAQFLRNINKNLTIGMFWHIPWPTYQIFRICPWKRELLEGMLANDLIGFHRSFHVRNFLDSVARELEANVDYDECSVRYRGHLTKVSTHGVGIDVTEVNRILEFNENKKSTIVEKLISNRVGKMIVGVDRIDYTKGIPRRLKAIDQFFTTYPAYRGRVSYVGVGSPSRTSVPSYQSLARSIERLVQRINDRHRQRDWQPIHTFTGFVDRRDTVLLLRDADVCMVTSLDDGMNLVAKEFVAANRRSGALVLSEFTGAARDLKDALLVNPYDDIELRESIQRALELPREERQQRLDSMRQQVTTHTVFDWAGEFLSELAHHQRQGE